MAIRKGTFVRYKKGSNFTMGKVERSFAGKATVQVDGVTITRHGSRDNRVLLIRDHLGGHELKLLNEVERIHQ